MADALSPGNPIIDTHIHLFDPVFQAVCPWPAKDG